MKIKRGHLYTADLNPRRGTEPGKIRPVLVVQTDFMNGEHPSTIVLLLTTKVRSDAQVLRIHLKKGEGGLKEDSDVMVDQLRAIDNLRFKREVGRLSPARLAEVEEKLSLILEIATMQT